VFGQLSVVLAHGPLVLLGQDIVDAQRHQPDDDGFVPVVDLAAAGWDLHRAQAAALALWTNYRHSTVDDPLLAELVVSIHEQDSDLTGAAGWDGDDIDALILSIAPPPLGDVLAEAGGDVDDPESFFSETISLTVPVPVAARWKRHVDPLGPDAPTRVMALLDLAGFPPDEPDT
jgi:CelD/BcsL family acetyltransferase involved in cellulose biosynthesis